MVGEDFRISSSKAGQMKRSSAIGIDGRRLEWFREQIAATTATARLFAREFLTFFEVKFAGGEDRDGFDALNMFRNPQVWDAGFVKFFA
jgi:hypothetical protein